MSSNPPKEQQLIASTNNAANYLREYIEDQSDKLRRQEALRKLNEIVNAFNILLELNKEPKEDD
jgi:hypothetical protein